MEIGVLGQEPTDLHLRIRTELESTKQLQHQGITEAEGGVALFTCQLSNRLGPRRIECVQEMRCLEHQRSASLRWNARAVELL